MELLRRITQGDETLRRPPRVGKRLHGPARILPTLWRADSGK
jgi:hypothetical protein